jgi:hypothetical protein
MKWYWDVWSCETFWRQKTPSERLCSATRSIQFATLLPFVSDDANVGSPRTASCRTCIFCTPFVFHGRLVCLVWLMLNILEKPPNKPSFRRKEPSSHLSLGNPRKNKSEAKVKKSERNASEFLTLDNLRRRSRANSTKSQASVVGKISERRLVSRVGRVAEVVCA